MDELDQRDKQTANEEAAEAQAKGRQTDDFMSESSSDQDVESMSDEPASTKAGEVGGPTPSVTRSSEGDEPTSAPVALTETEPSTGQESFVSSDKPSGKPGKPRRLIIGGVVAAILLLAVVVIAANASGVKVRTPGAYPDLPYLSTLIDTPDDFIRALNCDEAQAVYSDMKRTESWSEPITAEIDIDDLQPYETDAGEGTQTYPIIEIRFNDEGLIDYFHLVYIPVAVDNDLLQLTTSGSNEWPLQQTVAFELLSMFGSDSSTVTEEEVTSHIEQIKSECTILQPFVEEILTNPSSIVENYGFDTSQINALNESAAYSSWDQGYLRAFQVYILALQAGQDIPNVTTGMRYEAWFESAESPQVPFFYQALDYDTFFQDEGFINLHSGDSGMFCIGFCREGYWEPEQGTEQIEAWANDYLNTFSIDLWSFQEGSPTDSGIEG